MRARGDRVPGADMRPVSGMHLALGGRRGAVLPKVRRRGRQEGGEMGICSRVDARRPGQRCAVHPEWRVWNSMIEQRGVVRPRQADHPWQATRQLRYTM